MEFHKYTISKKGFWRKSFEIHKDGLLLYQVTSPGWLSYNHLIFRDTNDSEVLTIDKYFEFFKLRFVFHDNSGLKAELTRKLFSGEYILESEIAKYTAQSNWLGNEYTIYLGDDDIAKVSRKMMSNHKQYGIAIMEGNHDLFILGMIVSIELIRMTRNNG